jgi:hypothetical protein
MAKAAKVASSFLLATSGDVGFCDMAVTSSVFCRQEILSRIAFLATEISSCFLRGGCDWR